MIKKSLFFLLLLLDNFQFLVSEPSSAKIQTLYNSLDCSSVSEHLAFYQLYSQYPEGKKALQHTFQLLAGNSNALNFTLDKLPSLTHVINALVNLVNKPAHEETTELTIEELTFIEKLAERLPNRQLKGYFAKKEIEVLRLPPEEIDLARGLFLTQFGENDQNLQKIRSYEAMIDLMALQILTKLPVNATSEQKIRAINAFVFDELGYRFPPHSLYAKNIDLYTFLPSVLDSRRGVCLGVSILYICLAQRLNLSLEMITPPGHIYIRYREGEKIINIETTARGINMESDAYLSVETKNLQQRNIKEVIGLAHFNQASVYWKDENYTKAIESYKKAKPYIPNDKLLIELMAYNYLFLGDKEEGEALLKQVVNYIPDYAISKESIAEDYLNGHVEAEGIKPLFMSVDETRESILEKHHKLVEVVAKYPKFKNGIFTLAASWLQLNRQGEALEALERYHALEPNDPTAEYYLAALYTERHDFNKAWIHLQNAEAIVKEQNHNPKALRNFRKELIQICPE